MEGGPVYVEIIFADGRALFKDFPVSKQRFQEIGQSVARGFSIASLPRRLASVSTPGKLK